MLVSRKKKGTAVVEFLDPSSAVRQAYFFLHGYVVILFIVIWSIACLPPTLLLINFLFSVVSLISSEG